jgi:predicted TIM-barrel fold metal-dependent hydrolase
VIEMLGENQMMASADIPHGEAREPLHGYYSQPRGSFRAGEEKILGENAARFYNLS